MPIQPAVLIVDDDDLARVTTALQVESLGLASSSVADAGRALDWLAEHGEALVLIVDVNLRRGMSGDKFAELLTREHPELPVLLVSGMSRDEVDSPGGIPVLTKPFSIGDLRKAIISAVAAKEQPSPWADE